MQKLAYLLTEYPTLGHTFLLREIRELRSLGWDIQTISIRRPGSRPSPISAAETEEQAATWYILGGDLTGVLKSHAVTFATRPVRYLRRLFAAWRFGRFHPRQTFLATAYFAEAVCVGYRLRQAGITHVHSVFATTRSEERRVGKECRSRWSPYHYK